MFSLKMYKSSLVSDLIDQVVFVRNGIDELRRNITMHIDKDNNGGSFVDLDNSIKSKTHLKGYKMDQPVIETVLLGDLLQAASIKEKPSNIIMKMDIEGFECRAILGIILRTIYIRWY